MPEGRFNIGVWGEVTECGFAGCALGWASQIPEFKANGLTFEFVGLNQWGEILLNGTNLDGVGAAEKFFDLSYGNARYLFSDYSYKEPNEDVTPKMVAERIRELLNTQTA